MSTSAPTLYLKIEQNCIVYERDVTLMEIAKMECTDSDILDHVKQISLYRFQGNQKAGFVQVFSVLKVIELIHQKFPELSVVNLGESDFVIRYVQKPEPKWLQYIKVAVLCIILFFGSAFTIMTFIQDVSAADVFDTFYTRFTGLKPSGITPLEVGFCIGLAAGIMIFYNHIGQKKITDDPTPIQVAMRKYEQDIDTTYIEASGREGSSIDVDS
jgi:stage V sporulation protein AA